MDDEGDAKSQDPPLDGEHGEEANAALLSVLMNVKSSGSWAYCNSYSAFPPPGIHLGDDEHIPLPLSEEGAL